MARVLLLAAVVVLALTSVADAKKKKKPSPPKPVVQSLSFQSIPASPTVEFGLRAATKATIDGVEIPITFRTLLQSGATYPSFDGVTPWKAGTILDKFGVPLTTADAAEADPNLARDFDFSSMFVKFGKIWMITQNEDAFGNYYLFELLQSSSGALSIAKAKTLNIAAKYGTIRPCSGSVTPWLSHLAGEEDVVEARTYPPASAPGQFLAQQLVNRLGTWQEVNPYWYGWMVEIAVTNAAGAYSITKQYGLGRAYWETCVVMSDRRTTLCADDTGNGGVITLFVADRANDLSSGKLYASKPTQLNPADGGSFSIEWIPLNNGVSVSNAEIAAAIEKPFADSLKFADIFDYVQPVFTSPGVPNLTAMPAGFVQVKHKGNNYEWLRLKPNMQKYASVLETARMASYVGASTEWTKAEGITFDSVKNEIYFALSSIRRSMLDNASPTSSAWDLGGINAIRLPQNEPGAVYKMSIAKTRISQYTPVTARTVINSYGNPTGLGGNFSVPAGSIASPDNIAYVARYETLFIGEDCGDQHPNNFMWAYNLRTGEISRILSTPYDAEVTSPYYYRNIGKFSYLTATVQHPRMEDMPATVGYWVMPFEKTPRTRGRSMLGVEVEDEEEEDVEADE